MAKEFNIMLKRNFRFFVVFCKSRCSIVIVYTDGLMIKKMSNIHGEFSFWSTLLFQTDNNIFNSCKEMYGKQ